MIKKALVGLILTGAVGCVVYIFWQQELKYAKPTEVPEHYVPVLPGELVTLPSPLQENKAYFLHFYNPDCPCSRFNARHVQSLISNYQDSIQFAIVVPDEPGKRQAEEEFGSDFLYLTDMDRSIAKACGVYSTPQAAIITKDKRLYYRGNYNRARYCTTRASNFAELSLIYLMNKQPIPQFGLAATQSYGCALERADQWIEF